MSEEQIEQKKGKKWLKITAITLAVIVIVGGMGYGMYYYFSGGQLEPAQDFSVMTLGGQNFTLSEQQGKVVLIDFMSVTCGPCIALMPEMRDLYAEYNDSVVMLSVDVDPLDTEPQLLTFKTDYNASWAFALDTDNLLEKFGVLEIPKTVIIDKEGYITFAEVGLSAGGDKLEEALVKTIEGTAQRIATAIFGVSIGAAVISGVLSFFSPCAFPLLPGYMAYNLDLLVKDDERERKEEEEFGEEGKKKKKTFRQIFWKSFVWGSSSGAGIFIFYMIIGIVISILVFALGRGTEALDKFAEISEYIQLGVGILLIILGIISFTPFTINMSKPVMRIEQRAQLRREKRQARRMEKGKVKLDAEGNPKKRKIAQWMPQMTQLFVYGFTYALASIGCSLPILLGLVFTAINAGTFAKAIFIFLAYSLIMALLMIVITIVVGFSKEALITKMQASTQFVKILTGVLLTLAGLFLMGLFLWNWFT